MALLSELYAVAMCAAWDNGYAHAHSGRPMDAARYSGSELQAEYEAGFLARKRGAE